MADLRGFDANRVEPLKAFDPIPAGKYPAAITDSEMKPTKAGTGKYLQLTFEVIDGPYKGRKLWARLNLDNPNAQAVQIAQAELSAICRAVGVLAPNDSLDLHNLPLLVQVKVVKRQDSGELTNEIAAYEKREAAVPAPSAANNSVPPWRRT
jgi:Protein of unknown function (DUF669)